MDKKFSFSLFIFSIVFPSILYFKIGFRAALIVFGVLFALALGSFLSANFACFLKKTGKLLGQKLAVAALFLVYIFGIIPTKILMMIFCRDRLRLKNQKKESCWLEAQNNDNWDLQY